MLVLFCQKAKRVSRPADTQAAIDRRLLLRDYYVGQKTVVSSTARVVARFVPQDIANLSFASNAYYSVYSSALLLENTRQKLRQADCLVRRLRRRDDAARTALLLEELDDAKKRHDHSLCWRLSRLLSGKSIGPKKRLFCVPGVSLEKTDWEQYLRQPGCLGGCAASHEVDFAPASPNREVAEASRLARGDFSLLRKSFRVCKLRKAPPPWSPPDGIWRCLFFPDKYRLPKYRGIGYHVPELQTPKFHNIVQCLCVAIRRSHSTPITWHRSGAFVLGKNNGKEGCAAQRLLHSLDTLGKHFYAAVWRRAKIHVHRDYACAYLPGRRREQAILTQSLLAHRLRLAKISFCMELEDATNAFASVTHPRLRRFLYANCDDDFVINILLQRLAQATLVLKCADGELTLHIGSGTLPGDAIACWWFLGVYHSAIDQFCETSGERICLHCPWLARAIVPPCEGKQWFCEHVTAVAAAGIDVSLSSFADDIAKTRMIYGVGNLVRTSIMQSVFLSGALNDIGVSSNASKRELLVHFGGQGSQAMSRSVHGSKVHRFPGKLALHAKYLGVRLQQNGKFDVECKARCQAAQAGFYALGSFWRRSRDLNWKSSVFSNMVCGAATSGLAAVCLNKQMERSIDATVAQLARKALAGAACDMTGSHPKAKTNKDVEIALGFVRPSTQVRMQRLKLLQSLVRDPHLHIHDIAVLFGAATWEAQPCFDLQGKVLAGNEWYNQFCNDMRMLAAVSSFDDFLDSVLLQPSLLFTDDFIREAFLSIDVLCLRSSLHTVAIPPPGTVDSLVVESDEDLVTRDQHVCRVQVDGTDCGDAFASRQALAMHWARSKKPGHTKRFASFLTYSNQCILCCNYYASRRYATAHLQRSLATGSCRRARGSSTVFTCNVAPPYTCEICDIKFDDEDSARFHFATHLPSDIQVSF